MGTCQSRQKNLAFILLMNFKKQLQHYIRARNLTAAELARRSGVSKQSISNWLGGMEPRSFPHVKKVAEALSVSMDELVFGEQGMTRVIPEETLKSVAVTNPNSDIVCTLDANCRYLTLTTAMSEILGWPYDSYFSRSGMECVHPDDRQRSNIRFTQMVAARDNLGSFDIRHFDREGKYRWFRWRGMEIAEGILLAVGKDVTHEYPVESPDQVASLSVTDELEHTIQSCQTGPIGRGTQIDYSRTDDFTFKGYRGQFTGAIMAALHDCLAGQANSPDGKKIQIAQTVQNGGCEIVIEIPEGVETVPFSCLAVHRADMPDVWLRKHNGNYRISPDGERTQITMRFEGIKN